MVIIVLSCNLLYNAQGRNSTLRGSIDSRTSKSHFDILLFNLQLLYNILFGTKKKKKTTTLKKIY